MSHIELYLTLLIICLLFSAFFSGSETAFTSLQRVRVEHLMANKVRGARRVAKMIERPEKLLSTVLLGNTLVNAAAAALATALAISVWQEQGVLIATIGITITLLIFAETTPKTIAAQHAERLSLLLVRPLEFISILFAPFVFVLSWLVSAFTRLVGGSPVPRTLASPEEIRTMITLGHKAGTLEADEAEMLHKVFEFGDRPVREVMVPRPQVIAIEKGAKLADFLTLFAQSPLSRFPVYKENMDNVIGILSIKDVLMAHAKGTITDQTTLDSLARPAYFAPETKQISQLFIEMRQKNYRMAIIVDEFGGTAGIVSLDGLIEEIVGPVRDELAEAGKDYEIINDYTFQIDGSMRLEAANEEMGLELPEGDYETVAGFILHLLGHIPKPNDQLKYKGLKIVITEMRGRKIEKILLTRERQAGVSPETRRETKGSAKG